MQHRSRHRRTLLTSCLAALTAFAAMFTSTTMPASATPVDTTQHVELATSPDGAEARVDSIAPAQQALAGTWVHRDTFPDPLICQAVGAIYYWGRYRCEFFWFLWQLWVYYE